MIYVIGIGPGNPNYCLQIQYKLLSKAKVVFGSIRHLQVMPEEFQKKGVVAPKKLKQLELILNQYQADTDIVYLASGDPLIYGLGKWMKEHYKDNVTIIPGISSFQYLASKIGIPMNDAYLTSSHGKILDYELIAHLPKIFIVTDEKCGPFEISQALEQRSIRRKMIIGENLSYEDETITITQSNQVAKKEYKMNVVVILNEG